MCVCHFMRYLREFSLYSPYNLQVFSDQLPIDCRLKRKCTSTQEIDQFWRQEIDKKEAIDRRLSISSHFCLRFFWSALQLCFTRLRWLGIFFGGVDISTAHQDQTQKLYSDIDFNQRLSLIDSGSNSVLLIDMFGFPTEFSTVYHTVAVRDFSL